MQRTDTPIEIEEEIRHRVAAHLERVPAKVSKEFRPNFYHQIGSRYDPCLPQKKSQFLSPEN